METTDKLMEAAESLIAPAEQEEETQVEEVETDEAEAEDVETDDEVETAEVEDDEEAETDEDETDEAGPEKPDTFTVKVDGKDVQVTLEDLKRSYSGQAYIQKGMQEAAAVKKQLAEAAQNLQAEQQRFMQFAQQVQQQGIMSPPRRPDPKLAETDPLGYIQAEAKFNDDVQRYQAQQMQMQQMQRQQQQFQEQQRMEVLRQQAQILMESIPEFADPQKRTQFQERVKKTGVEYGYSEEEMLTIEDARAIKVLHDAMKWRELQSAKAKAKKQPEAPRNVKPTARRPEPQQLVRAKKLKQAKQSGRLTDFADLILE